MSNDWEALLIPQKSQTISYCPYHTPSNCPNGCYTNITWNEFYSSIFGYYSAKQNLGEYDSRLESSNKEFNTTKNGLRQL